MMRDDFEGMSVFLAVAEVRSLRGAGDRLGVSGSAVSQALRRLEDRLGVALVQRTTRSVRLTEAGERLYAAVRPAAEGVRAAVAAVSALGDAPRGMLRLQVSPGADSVLASPLLAEFLARYPDVQLDVHVSEARVDIVAGGYDAAIQLGEVIDRDMVAVPVGGDMRFIVVGAPSYFKRHAPPRHPRDLAEHVCINWHLEPDAPPYRWEFTEGGRDFAVTVPAHVLSTDPAFNLRLARAGMGLTMTFEDRVRDELARGELVSVLDAFCTPFPGYFLHYPTRRQASPALRALVDHLNNEPETMKAVMKEIPLGRLGRAEEIASAVLWLCGPGAGFAIGQALVVDGGYTIR
ncbi:LysR family transcriptional regulator [Cystobacter fuscus]|uniref:LysR family transcriptional regulator n=2 Tax=Cystobacter fuscus TaxID=43 RepID=A0A250J450_9BACT|nr:LysR family transcriptional regulator [Cystobacter fuscus]